MVLWYMTLYGVSCFQHEHEDQFTDTVLKVFLLLRISEWPPYSYEIFGDRMQIPHGSFQHAVLSKFL